MIYRPVEQPPNIMRNMVSNASVRGIDFMYAGFMHAVGWNWNWELEVKSSSKEGTVN